MASYRKKDKQAKGTLEKLNVDQSRCMVVYLENLHFVGQSRGHVRAIRRKNVERRRRFRDGFDDMKAEIAWMTIKQKQVSGNKVHLLETFRSISAFLTARASH